MPLPSALWGSEVVVGGTGSRRPSAWRRSSDCKPSRPLLNPTSLLLLLLLGSSPGVQAPRSLCLRQARRGTQHKGKAMLGGVTNDWVAMASPPAKGPTPSCCKHDPQEKCKTCPPTSHAFSLPPLHTHTQEMRLYSFLVGASLMGSVVGFMPSMRVQQRGLGKSRGGVGVDEGGACLLLVLWGLSSTAAPGRGRPRVQACRAREAKGGRGRGGLVKESGLRAVGASKSAADEWEYGGLRERSLSPCGADSPRRLGALFSERSSSSACRRG